MTEIWHIGLDADRRLKEFGLERSDVGRPLEIARADALTCTQLDAYGAPGYMFWSRANRYLREQLIPSGWSWTNRDNILRTIHPAGRLAITAISASGQVGVPRGLVRTKNPKGGSIAGVVRYNASIAGYLTQQPPLPGLEFAGVEAPFEPDMLPTWFLLYRVTKHSIFSELSLPVEMYGSTVNRWLEHIILDEIPFSDDGNEIDLNGDGPDDQGPDVDVERIA